MTMDASWGDWRPTGRFADANAAGMCACTGNCRLYGSCHPPTGRAAPFPYQEPYQGPGFGTHRWPTDEEVAKLLGDPGTRVVVRCRDQIGSQRSPWPAPPPGTDATLDAMT